MSGRRHPNLVGWWQMENNLLDWSGEGNNGTVGEGSEAYAAGVFGRAANMDGDDIYILGGSILLQSSGDFSAFAWVNVPANPSGPHGALFTQDNSGMFYLYTTFGTGAGRMRFNGVPPIEEILIGDDIRGVGWTHIGLVRAGDSFRFFRDAAEIANNTSGKNLSTSFSTRIGVVGNPPNDRRPDAILDDVRIYNAALTPEDIQRVYRGQQPARAY